MERTGKPASGGCQCGAIRYHATTMLDNSHLCHCRMCQKAVGNIFAALVAAPNEAITWTRGTPSVFKSSEHVSRGFCSQCGTPLFYRDDDNGRTNFTIGSLDNPNDYPPGANTCTENMVTWYDTVTRIENTGSTESEDKAWADAIKASNNQHPDHDTDHWPPADRQDHV